MLLYSSKSVLSLLNVFLSNWIFLQLIMVAHLLQNSTTDFYMLKKWIMNVQEMIFLCSTNDFRIQ